MDFIDWCELVLTKIIHLNRSSDEVIRLRYVSASLLESELSVELSKLSQKPCQSGHRQILLNALDELSQEGFIEKKKIGQMIQIKLTQKGREIQHKIFSYWESICGTLLDTKQEQVLRLINSLSHQKSGDNHCLEWVTATDFDSPFDSDEDKRQFDFIATELRDLGFIKYQGFLGPRFDLRASYKGVVWETRRAITLETVFIDKLVSEWETTSVDFKRELYLNDDNQKAEFVKDVLSLANTQASGKRWMIIGFDDKARKYHCAPDPGITQDRLEQILACYASPMVNIRYEIVAYKAGPVGKLEIFRMPTELPYSVAKAIGVKKKIRVGQIFVRHGSHSEEATPTELLALQEERDFAKAAQAKSS